MSDYEQHSGKLRKIEIKEGETLASVLEGIAKKKKIKWTEEYKQDPEEFVSDNSDEFLIVDGELYQIYDWIEEEEEDSFCRLTPLPDGSLSFISRFYNGGTYLGEMLEDEIKSYNKKCKNRK